MRVGTIVETCSLMPGVVKSISNGQAVIQMLDTASESNCSVKHCALVAISPKQAIQRLAIGRAQLSRMYLETPDTYNHKSKNKLFQEAIDRAYTKITTNVKP